MGRECEWRKGTQRGGIWARFLSPSGISHQQTGESGTPLSLSSSQVPERTKAQGLKEPAETIFFWGFEGTVIKWMWMPQYSAEKDSEAKSLWWRVLWWASDVCSGFKSWGAHLQALYLPVLSLLCFPHGRDEETKPREEKGLFQCLPVSNGEPGPELRISDSVFSLGAWAQVSPAFLPCRHHCPLSVPGHAPRPQQQLPQLWDLWGDPVF